MSMLHLAILSPLLFAFFIPFLSKYLRKIHTGWFVLVLPVLLFVYFIQMIKLTMSGIEISRTFDWIPSLGIYFTARVDGLSLLFALLITGIGALVTLYSIYYMSKKKEDLGSFYVYFLMFMGAMLGVVLIDDLLVLYLFWELTSLSSFLLIGFWNQRSRSRYGAAKSLLITVFGGLSMLGGFILLYIMTETFSIHEMMMQADIIAAHPYALPALILILLGAFTKSAQFPFYIWLPDAMEAPTPVSAYLHSATMVKAGLYIVARFTPIFALTSEWMWIVTLTGLFTLFWGSFHAVKQTDLKGILAFSTVSQLGMIMSMLGAGSAAYHYDQFEYYSVAIVAAIFHLINHSTFKGSLFMAAGIIDHETGTRDIRKLGGLMTLMPITFTIALIGTFSMAGLPPFNGFLSKEMFFTSMLHLSEVDIFNFDMYGTLFPMLAWIGSVFTFIYSIRLLFKTFLGKHQPEKLEKAAHEAPLGMLISPVILASLAIVIFFFPNLIAYTLIEPAVSAILPGLLKEGEHFAVHISWWHGFSPELRMTIAIVVLGIIAYATLPKWKRIYRAFPDRLSLNNAYDHLLAGLQKTSSKITKTYMTGFLRDYLNYIFVFFILMLGGTLIFTGSFAFQTKGLANIGVYEMILSLVMVISALTTILARSRLAAIIALGVVGYSLALFFVIFRAPDLALTQLIIETISVALFLLCFYHLPKLRFKPKTTRFKLTNLIISAGVGLVVTLIAIAAQSQRSSESIADFFIENSYKLAGGKNIVNVILVDFRGFDTLFEITVLVIAALGIYGLLNLQVNKEGEER
ncbi:Na+/H+ antiporter subunit A [Bacillus gobiensis]|uniref:Na+/H+ antiporter subunit A n=1 Tax=Bacillus gobiensis TaxID=1441095 RepID=UPI003D201A35